MAPPFEVAYPGVALEVRFKRERNSGRSVYAEAATIPRLASTADQMDTSL
jgi:hypothetical protein